MKSTLAVSALLLCVNSSMAWFANTIHTRQVVRSPVNTLRDDAWDESLMSSEGEIQPVSTAENPCWQDIYDDDCSMSTVYSASFVAMDWIKSMPCAKGMVLTSL